LLERLLRYQAEPTQPARPRRILIVEPISERISPWWDEWAKAFDKLGGRADIWKARIATPPIVTKLAKASGLRPELLTARSLFL
jgi:hypothetical protein